MPIDESLPLVPVRIAVVKVMDNRDTNDSSKHNEGVDVLVERAQEAGHQVVSRDRVASKFDAIVERVSTWVSDPAVDCVIAIGGTGLSSRDVTHEAIAHVWEHEIPGFGELFRMISYQSVGSSAMQSRACAGLAGGVCLFAIPGSPGGVQDAWDALIGPQLDSRHRPCNLIEHLNCGCRG